MNFEVLRLSKFGLVGITASFTHSMIFYFCNEAGFYHVLSNIGAFTIAFFVSALGNFLWVFPAQGKSNRLLLQFFRFFLVALAGLTLNMVWGFFSFDFLHFRFSLGVFIFLQLLVTPMIVYLLTRNWVFRV